MSKRFPRGLLDTSVLIDAGELTANQLPATPEICSVTLAELGMGLHTTKSQADRAERAERLQQAEMAFTPLPFDDVAARRFTHMVGLVVAAGRSPRPRRMDLMIAAIASVNDLPLYTRNPDDFIGLDTLVTLVPV